MRGKETSLLLTASKPPAVRKIGFWILELLWSLELGAWNFPNHFKIRFNKLFTGD